MPRVSIHAPARGATPPPLRVKCPSESFNSRSREGSDLARIAVALSGMFQFTLPRGERLNITNIHLERKVSFNSRSREGSDLIIGIYRR